jgi:hypothetical protein
MPDPWETEIDFYIAKGMDPGWARALVINSWMYAGDLLPLRAAINQSPVLDVRVLVFLAKMIDEDRLTINRKKYGAGSSPKKFSRNIAAAYLYKDKISKGMRSDDAFEQVADELGNITSDNVRKILTWFNKNWNGKQLPT